ncbi:hypothetical protein SAMN05421503_2104 [Terribacillus aidingensis]|uniref:Uncharacterized protein n=1 Tax=Terribacillus aidingensis TaxID=586416 RepID=A0A285NQ99_9BACI|nr:hypothetical protein [Terribacillus aidingensis]SNZ11629.1 hypothetical protein SAMN05421503_2104 [Terribacillus aidingensis]
MFQSNWHLWGVVSLLLASVFFGFFAWMKQPILFFVGAVLQVISLVLIVKNMNDKEPAEREDH